MEYKDKALAIVVIKLYLQTPKMVKMIDSTVMKCAMGSHNFRGGASTTYKIATDIIKLTNHKKELLFLCKTFDGFLSSLNERIKQFFHLKFIRRKSSIEIIKTLRMTQRTYFRLQALFYSKLIKCLHADDYSLNYIYENLFHDKSIESMTLSVVEECRNSIHYTTLIDDL